MPPRLPPPPLVSKSGNAPKLGESESSKPMPEPDPWLLGEIEALAGAAEASGAKPPSEASTASESSGAKHAPSEASGSRKPIIGSEPGVMPAKPTRSATAALVGIGDDLIANASPEDKPLFTAIVAKAEAKSAAGEPDVFDELGLAKTPAVITGQTLNDVASVDASQTDAADAGPPPKKTDEGFPVPPPRPAPSRHTSPSTAASPPRTSPSTAASTKPMSRWTPHVLLGTLGLASIIAIGFRCSGTSTNTAQAGTGATTPIVANAGDDARGGVAHAGAGGSQDGKAADDPLDDGARGGAADDEDEDVKVEGEAQGDRAGAEAGDPDDAGAADDPAAAPGEAAAPSEDEQAQAAGDADEESQAADAPTNDAAPAGPSGTAKDTTPASTSSKPKSRTSPTPIGPSTPSPEANMTAEELLALARKAWAAGNARDTYKYANKSRYKQPSTEATELATLSACKLDLEKSAKSTFDDLSGDKRRKVRQKCREYGMRLGL